MAVVLLALYWMGSAIGRLLGLPAGVSHFIGAVISFVLVLIVNAPFIKESHAFKDLCERDAQRTVHRVVSDVEAIQVRGNSGGLWQNSDDLRYRRVYGAPRSVEVEDRLPVRYEVQVSRTQVSKLSSRIDQRIIDLTDDNLLAVSRSYEFDSSVGAQGLEALFLMPWWLPALPFAPPISRCPSSSASGFVREVLVPKH